MWLHITNYLYTGENRGINITVKIFTNKSNFKHKAIKSIINFKQQRISMDVSCTMYKVPHVWKVAIF
jgi:hypothetical protein